MTNDALGAQGIAAWWSGLAEEFGTQQGDFTELDRLAGDGDFGLNMDVALGRMTLGLAALESPTVAEQLRVITRVFADNGGSSGPLLSAVFRELARAASNDKLTLSAIAYGVRIGTDRIQTLGGAKPGDSTMVDALDPAARSLRNSVDAGQSLAEGLAEAARAARAGAALTGDMTSRRGRASYVGERSHAVEDPGAVFVALMFETLARVTATD